MNYRIGDVTYPQTKNPCIIPHIVNNVGLWGSGVVVAISKRWKEPEKRYREGRLKLGETQFIGVESDKAPYPIIIANMCAQKGVGRGDSYKIGKMNYIQPPIRYDCLLECMLKVGKAAWENKLEIHAPKFGSDRAGGDWTKIEGMIKEIWENNGISVDIYEYEE